LLRTAPCDIMPTNPETELTKIKAAETAAVSFKLAHPKMIIRGLRIMPPPIPISPLKNPSKAPMTRAR